MRTRDGRSYTQKLSFPERLVQFTGGIALGPGAWELARPGVLLLPRAGHNDDTLPRDVDAPANLFSVGVVLYHYPTEGKDLSKMEFVKSRTWCEEVPGSTVFFGLKARFFQPKP